MLGRPSGWPVIRGLACPFDSVDGNGGAPLEFVERGAFDVADPAAVNVLAFAHDGPEVAPAGHSGLRLWQNDLGLCFEVAIRPGRASADLIAALDWGQTGCSVQFGDYHSLPVAASPNGRPAQKVYLADLVHIAVAVPNPFYRESAAWSVDRVSALPARLQFLADRVATGYDVPILRRPPAPVATSPLSTARPARRPSLAVQVEWDLDKDLPADAHPALQAHLNVLRLQARHPKAVRTWPAAASAPAPGAGRKATPPADLPAGPARRPRTPFASSLISGLAPGGLLA